MSITLTRLVHVLLDSIRCTLSIAIVLHIFVLVCHNNGTTPPYNCDADLTQWRSQHCFRVARNPPPPLPPPVIYSIHIFLIFRHSQARDPSV